MRILSRLRNLFRDDRHSNEIAEELAFHIEMRTEENIRAGMSPAAARGEAERRFGNRTQISERTRDFDIPRWLDEVRQNVRYGLRALRSSRGASVVLVASLALGIGANTAMFTVLNSLLLRQLPVREASSLYSVTLGNFCSYGWVERQDALSHALWTELRTQQDFFSDLFAYATDRLDLSRGGGEVRLISGAYATSEMWSVLGLRPVTGRFTNRSDEKPGSTSAVAVLGEVFWESEYGRDPGIVGRTITVVGRPVTVIGVAPGDFFGLHVGARVDVFLPLEASAWLYAPRDTIGDGQHWWLTAVGRLRSGATPDAARSWLQTFSPAAMQRTFPSNWPNDKNDIYLRQVFQLSPAGIGFSDVRETLTRPLLIASGLLALLLILACANIAAVQLSRGLARQREFAVRVALGASRLRLACQVFVESLIAATAGAVLGVALSFPATRLLVSQYTTRLRSIDLDLQPDLRVLGFTAVLAVLTALLFGLAPAVQAMRTNPHGTLRSVRATSGHRPLREWLIATQAAIAVVLAVSALLFAGTLHRLTAQDTGLHANNVLLMDLETERAGIEADQRSEFYGSMLNRLSAVPGAANVAASYVTPLSGGAWRMNVHVGNGETGKTANVYMHFVTPDFFDVYGTPLLAGEAFPRGIRAGSPHRVLVNGAFVRGVLGGEPWSGKRVRCDMGDKLELNAEITGVVADAKYRNLRAPAPATVYVPMALHAVPPQELSVAIKAKGATSDIVAGVRRTMEELNPAVAYTLRDFDQQVADSVVNERAIAAVTGLFGTLALLLAGVGIYGVAAYSVMQRRTEIGIRLAVGASTGRVLRCLFTRTGAFVAAGAVAGGVCAAWAARLAQSLLFGVSPGSVWIYALAAGALFAIAAIAIAGPALRAARLDPVQTLRVD